MNNIYIYYTEIHVPSPNPTARQPNSPRCSRHQVARRRPDLPGARDGGGGLSSYLTVTKLMSSYLTVTKLMSSYFICNETHVVLLDCKPTWRRVFHEMCRRKIMEEGILPACFRLLPLAGHDFLPSALGRGAGQCTHELFVHCAYIWTRNPVFVYGHAFPPVTHHTRSYPPPPSAGAPHHRRPVQSCVRIISYV